MVVTVINPRMEGREGGSVGEREIERSRGGFRGALGAEAPTSPRLPPLTLYLR